MIKKICCIGAGFVGGPTMAVMASKCPDIEFNVVDINNEKINKWNNQNLDELPVYEPGLRLLIEKYRNKNLFFSTEINKCISESDIIFISVNTPIKVTGLGAGQASDLKWVESSSRTIAANAKGHTIVVEKSTLPVRTAKVIKDILSSSVKQENLSTNKKTFSVLSNPEFLAEGTAIQDLTSPDRILIGGEDSEAIDTLKNIYLNWISEEKIVCTNLWSSELSKLTSNAFLAQRISSINSISAICEQTGADVQEVSLSIGLDSRIGDKFLKTGPGFGGSCFKKDILNLVYLCKQFNLNEVAEYWEKVVEMNNWQKKRIYRIIVEKLFGNLSEKKIVILGFAFKANTNDTRESAAIQIASDLLSESASLVFLDPKVDKKQIKKDMNNYISNYTSMNFADLKISFCDDVYEAAHDADAIVILTEWHEYKNLDWSYLSSIMRSPPWVFDTRAIVDKKNIKDKGINLWMIGDGTITKT